MTKDVSDDFLKRHGNLFVDVIVAKDEPARRDALHIYTNNLIIHILELLQHERNKPEQG